MAVPMDVEVNNLVNEFMALHLAGDNADQIPVIVDNALPPHSYFPRAALITRSQAVHRQTLLETQFPDMTAEYIGDGGVPLKVPVLESDLEAFFAEIRYLRATHSSTTSSLKSGSGGETPRTPSPTPSGGAVEN